MTVETKNGKGLFMLLEFIDYEGEPFYTVVSMHPTTVTKKCNKKTADINSQGVRLTLRQPPVVGATMTAKSSGPLVDKTGYQGSSGRKNNTSNDLSVAETYAQVKDLF